MFLQTTSHKLLCRGAMGSTSLLGSTHNVIPFLLSSLSHELRWYQSCCAVGIWFLTESQKEKTCIISCSSRLKSVPLSPFAYLPGALIWILCLGWTGFPDTVTSTDFTSSVASPDDFSEREDRQDHCQAATQPRVQRCQSVILTKYKIQSQ